MSSAGEQEWVKATDPLTGMAYYVNQHTRKTQWEPPIGWTDEYNRMPQRNSSSDIQTRSNTRDTSSSLPPNWEVSHDHKTGKPFYIDLVNKVTTWERPKPIQERSQLYRSNQLDYSSSNPSNLRGKSGGASVDVSNLLSQNEKSGWSTEKNAKPTSSSYNYSNHIEEAGDTIPALEFSVVSIKNEARANCPGCGVMFSIPLKRRHHCRLCGDVFCDSCTSNRALLPLDGPEYEKPARVCDSCFSDIQSGNYFSMRRYLAPLQLFDHKESLNNFIDGGEEKGSGITESLVCAALAALTSDLNAVLLDATSFHEKITIPAEILVPAITRHLEYSGTSDRAICALSTLLALGKIVVDNSFANAVYMQSRGTVMMDSILQLLEQSGSSRHTLFFQEQAARAIFYLSDEELLSNMTPEDQTLDLHRSLRNMLDHATCSVSPSLQRWAAACIRNLIIQDQHRTTLYANSGTSYDSFTTQLVSTGGVMILCSLIAGEDADTRAHAISALSAVIRAARNLNQNKVDSDLVTAIANSGGCGKAISQLLLSSDTNVTQMSVTFASHLVAPLLGFKVVPMFLGSGLLKADFLRPYCDAAIALVIDGDCLPALVQLISPSSMLEQKSSLIEVKVRAMETVSAIAIACNLYPDSTSSKVKEVKSKLLSYQVHRIAYDILCSTATQSLNSARDSPETQLREAAGLFLGQMLNLDDTNETLNYLSVNKAAIVFLTLAGDDGMFHPSGLVGEWAPRCLPWVEAASILLTKVWYQGQSLLCKSPSAQLGSSVSSTASNSGFSSETLDCLLEVIDAGAVQLLTQILDRKPAKNTSGEEHLKISACHAIAAMFGIAHGDNTNLGALRLYDAVQASASVFSAVGHSRSGKDLITLTLSFSHSVSRRAQHEEKGDSPLNELSEAALMAAGSVCGTYIGCNTKNNMFLEADKAPVDFTELVVQDDYTLKKETTCNQAINILFSEFNPFPAMLVGAYGECSISPAIRLALVIALYGKFEARAKLASTLIPLCDILRQALVDGDRYLFTSTIALVRYCGPYATAENSRELLKALSLAIKTLASVVNVNEAGYKPGIELDTLIYLKENCIYTFEALSCNQAFWSTLATNAFGPLADFLRANDEWDEEDIHRRKILCSALSTIQNVIALQSHAVAACEANLLTPIARIVCGKKDIEGAIDKRTRDGRRRALQREKTRRENQIEYDVKLISLNLLHSLISNKEARKCGSGLIDNGVIRAACFAVGGCTEATDPNQSLQGSNTITRMGLEIIHYILSDLKIPHTDKYGMLVWSEESKKFVDQVARQSRFLRALCATMLLSWNDSGYTIHPLPGSHASDSVCSEIAPLYGPPLVTYDGTCAGYTDSIEASVALLFSIASLCSSSDASFSEAFWDTFLMKEDRSLVNAGSKKETSVTACAVFLSILMDEEEGCCIPEGEENEKFYFSHSLSTVRKRLLDGLSSSFSDVFKLNTPSASEDGMSALAALKKFQVPSMCIALCGTSPALIEPAFHLIQGMTSSFPDEILPHMIRDELTLRAALNMVNYPNEEDESGSSAQIRLLFAKIICVSATKGILGPALERFDLRNRAISSLSAACKIGEDEIPQYCLKALVTIFSSSKGTLQLSAKEAKTMAKNLGGTISSMVLDRFAMRATEHYTNNSTHNTLEQEPEVELLCSLASYKEALAELCHVGGLEAISLVSSDGVPSAILAMYEVVKDDPSVILDIEGHISVMDVLNSDSQDQQSSAVYDMKKYRKTKVSFEFLAALCNSSTMGRKAVSDASSCASCIHTACDIICSYNEMQINSFTKKKMSGESSSHPEPDKDLGLDRKMASTAAISFLSELAHAKSSREKIFKNSRLLEVLVSLGKKCYDFDIVIHSAGLLKSLSPYVSPGIPESGISSSFFASIFSDILGRTDILLQTKFLSKKTSLKFNIEDTSKSNNDLMFATAAAGLEYVFDEMDISEKGIVFLRIFDHMVRLTEELSKNMFSRQRRSVRPIPKNSGLLALNISTLLLLWRSSSPESTALMKPAYFAALLKLIIAHQSIEQRFESERPEAETSYGTELCYLTVARTQCLQFLSGMMRNNVLTDALNISWSGTILDVDAQIKEKKVDYMNSVEIFSNDDTLEKEYDFISVLGSIIQNNTDKVAAMHALRIQERLGW